MALNSPFSGSFKGATTGSKGAFGPPGVPEPSTGKITKPNPGRLVKDWSPEKTSKTPLKSTGKSVGK